MGEELQSKYSPSVCRMDKLADSDAGQEIYRFDGSDEYLLEKIAEAFDEVRDSETES